MGKFFLRLEMIDEGLEQLLKAETLGPERESVNILLAEAFRRRGRYESACSHYQRAFGYKRRYLIPSGVSSAALPPSSGPRGAPPAGHGTGTPSTTATGSTQPPPPPLKRHPSPPTRARSRKGVVPPVFPTAGEPRQREARTGRLRLRDSSSVCAASEAGSVRGSPCDPPARLRFTSLRPPPAATPPGSPVAGRLHAVFSIRCRIRALKHLTLSTWFGELRDLLPAASPDLSSSAVALWPALASPCVPRCGAFEGPGPGPHPFPCGLCAAAPPRSTPRAPLLLRGRRSPRDRRDEIRRSPLPCRRSGPAPPRDPRGGWRDLIPDGAPPTVVRYRPIPGNISGGGSTSPR